MKPINFTKAALEELPFLNHQYEVRDTKTPGLIIRINGGGTKTFMYYRKVRGRLLRIKIGRFPELTVENGRKLARMMNGQANAGIRPHLVFEEERREPTFRQLFDKYYREHTLLHNKRPRPIKATIEYHLMPKIGSFGLSEITRAKMKEVHIEQGLSKGKIQANKVLDIARAVFNFAIREDVFMGSNPCIGIKRFRAKSRDRFLSKAELTSFFVALKYEAEIYQDFFMLSLFIGARKTTMLQMQYTELDFELNRWRLSEDQSKNGDVNVYMLCDEAMEILKRRAEANSQLLSPSPFVFPGDGQMGHLIDPKKSWARIKKRMGVADIRMHDLRRTLGSYMAITNTSLPIIGKALNHKSQDSTAIYARLSLDPVLEAVNSATKAMRESVPAVEEKLLPASFNYGNNFQIQYNLRY